MNFHVQSGWTTVKVAAAGGHTETVLLLLNQGVDINAKDEVRRALTA